VRYWKTTSFGSMDLTVYIWDDDVFAAFTALPDEEDSLTNEILGALATKWR
jgi:hypothetical protein